MIEQDPRYQIAVRDAEIKRLRLEEKMTLQEIGDKFGISRGRVHQIIGNTGNLRFEDDWVTSRFWKKVDKSGDCWEWTGSTVRHGYGQFRFGDGVVRAHRLAYIFTFGPIPDGLCVCHHCDNPICVRPSHLFVGTRADNMKDSVSKGRSTRGEKHHGAKLCENDVREIRRLYSLGATQTAIAKMWGISRGHVNRIVHRKTWKHI